MPDITSLFVFPFLLILFRVGAGVMVFPGFADTSVNPRIRLLLALAITLILFSFLGQSLPALPASTPQMLSYMFMELFVGFCLGIGARLFMTAMNLAGELIAFMSGLQASTLFDPSSGANTTAPTLLLMVIVGVLVLVLNIHHMLIEALVQSYSYFPPGTMPSFSDSLQAVIIVMGHMMEVAVKLAAPVMITGFLGYVAFGIFNRLIPQLQVFFVALPLTIAGGLFMLGVSLAVVLSLFMNELKDNAILFMVQP